MHPLRHWNLYHNLRLGERRNASVVRYPECIYTTLPAPFSFGPCVACIARPGRPALALDVIEPFRPLIADSIAITCFNKGELTEGHFVQTAANSSLRKDRVSDRCREGMA